MNVKIKRIFEDVDQKWVVYSECLKPVKPNAGLRVKFRQRIWDWQMYDSAENEDYDYWLLYTPSTDQMSMHDTTVLEPYESNKPYGTVCECGAKGIEGHMFFCPKYPNRTGDRKA